MVKHEVKMLKLPDFDTVNFTLACYIAPDSSYYKSLELQIRNGQVIFYTCQFPKTSIVASTNLIDAITEYNNIS